MEHPEENTIANHNDSTSQPPASTEYVQTPRGRFRVIAADRGDDPALSEWFEHEGWILVTDGDCAYAIAKTDWRRPLLNQDLVRRANSVSHYDAGSSIEKDARHALGIFERKFPENDFTDKQMEYLDQRRAQWREFVLKHYNEQCHRRANFVPVTVSGPARYPGAKMQKRVDRIMASSAEFAEKADRFFDNTKARLYELLPLEKKLERMRSGKWTRGETIPANDPHVVELLEAKAAYLEGTLYKGMPAYDRQHTRAMIKGVRTRIATIKSERESPTIQGWEFEGGRVVANQEANRLQVFFDDDRRDQARSDAMLGQTFRWSRRNRAWQRHLTMNAVRAARRALEKLAAAK